MEQWAVVLSTMRVPDRIFVFQYLPAHCFDIMVGNATVFIHSDHQNFQRKFQITHCTLLAQHQTDKLVTTWSS